MNARTTEAGADAEERAVFARFQESKSGGLADNSAAAGAGAPAQPADGDQRGISGPIEQPSTEFKTYGPGEVTPLDELLRPAETTPAVDATALADEVARRQAVVDRLETDVAKTRQRLAELDGSRADVVLNGGDLDALHNGLRDAEQLVKTLEAGLTPARAMLAKAQAAVGKAALETQAAAVKAEHQAAAAEAMMTMYKLLAGVCHSATVLEEHALAIEGMNQQALGNDRRDLVIDMDILRRAVLDTIGTRHASIVAPVRTGESDEAFEARLWSVVASNAGVAPNGKKERGTTVSSAVLAECSAMHVERRANEGDDGYSARRWAAVAGALRLQLTDGENEADHRDRLRYALARRLNVDRKGESDEAYHLRLANAHSALVTAREQSDPLRAVGEKALAVIKRHALGLEKIALHRQHAEVRELRPMSGDTDLMRRYGRRSD